MRPWPYFILFFFGAFPKKICDIILYHHPCYAAATDVADDAAAADAAAADAAAAATDVADDDGSF